MTDEQKAACRATEGFHARFLNSREAARIGAMSDAEARRECGRLDRERRANEKDPSLDGGPRRLFESSDRDSSIEPGVVTSGVDRGEPPGIVTIASAAPRRVLVPAAAAAAAMGVRATCEAVRLILSATGY